MFRVIYFIFIGAVVCLQKIALNIHKRKINNFRLFSSTSIDPRNGDFQRSKVIDFSSSVVEFIMKSPLYGPIVNMARSTMIETAKSIGIQWEEKYNLLRNNVDWEVLIDKVLNEKGFNSSSVESYYPSYYKQRFHGYIEGNLCLQSAIEQELAGKAVGARNFPQSGIEGENMLRGSIYYNI